MRMPNGQAFERPNLLKRLHGFLGGKKDWHSAPGQRASLKLLGHSELPGPDFSKRDDFTLNLYENLYALDIQNLGFRFRLFGWVRVLRKGPYNGVRMVYVWPSFEAPTKCSKVEQIDLAPSKPRADRLLWKKGQQEFMLSLHQQQFHRSDTEQWFQQIFKQTIAIEAFPESPTELYSWKSTIRSYWILRTFMNEVEFLAVLSGFDETEVGAILGMLVPLEGNIHLAEWHDKEHREFHERRNSSRST